VSSVLPDASRTFFNLIVWAQLELQLGIMCASAPSLRGFFRRYLGGSMASRALKSDTPDQDTSGSRIGNALSNVFHRKRMSDVKELTSDMPAFGQSKTDYAVNEITLETSIESTSVHRAWSATPSREHLTRSSTGGESIPLQDMWKDPGQSGWDGRL
jgi:hypothetical protein